MSIEASIREKALSLGFVACGFTPLSPAESFPHFSAWLASGRAAGMRYLERNQELREDPRKLAPGAQSAIVVAARYPANPEPGRGFSSYARGRDYHDVIREKLQALAGFIAKEASVAVTRITVDSAPVLEREWAIRAGIGWQGKQGQVVHPEYGCCLFLGILFIDIDLAASAPVANQCGDCRECLDACPTKALEAPRVVDAGRCISYLTIEHEGAIPDALHARMGGELFGCDRCTAVCPFNPSDDSGVMPQFLALDMPGPQECLDMTEVGFKERFKGTAVYRSGLARLQRNARGISDF